MQRFKYITLFALFILGCSNEFTAEKAGVIEVGGEAGESNSDLGGASNMTAGAGGSADMTETAGSSMQMSGSGGMVNSAGTSGSNNVGGMLNAGSGGTMSTAGTAGTAGMHQGGTGGKTCTPITCEDFKAEVNKYNTNWPDKVDNHSVLYYDKQVDKYNVCGLVNDGCGNQLNCGGCADPYERCNVPNVTYNRQSYYFTPNITNPAKPNFFSYPAPANTCVGGCAYMPNKVCPIDTSLGNKYLGYKVFACLSAPDDYLTNLPDNSCEESDEGLYLSTNATFKAHIFCCKPNH